jgi:hypothetical protein
MKLIIQIIIVLLTVPLILGFVKLFMMFRPESGKGNNGNKAKKKDNPPHPNPKVSHIFRRDEIPDIEERKSYPQRNNSPDNNNQPSTSSSRHKRSIGRPKNGVNRN